MDKQKEENSKLKSTKKIFVDTIKKYIKNYWWKLLIIAFLLAVDIITKSLIVKFDSYGNVILTQTPIIDGVLYIWPTANEGAAWSILYGKTVLLIILTVVFLAMIVVYDVCFKKKSVFFGIATGMIVAGAMGNLIDRIAFGKVRDFIYFSPIDFPVFNVADICLTVGIALFAVYMVVSMVIEKHNETISQQAENNSEKTENTEDLNKNKDNVNDKVSQKNIEENINKKNKTDTISQNDAGDDNAKNIGWWWRFLQDWYIFVRQIEYD